MNNGKRFEDNFRKSIPDNMFYYRFRDGTSSWDKSSKTRFQAKNICDCMLHDGEYLYLLELKSHKGKSLPLSAIRQNQVDDLLLAAKHRNIIAGLVVEFSDLGQVYFMPIELVNNWYYHSDRKSIPLQSFQNSPCIEIYGKKKKVNYRYNIEQFIIDAVGGYLCD